MNYQKKNTMTTDEFYKQAEDLKEKLGHYELMLLASRLAGMMDFIDKHFAPQDPTCLYDKIHLEFGMCVVSLGKTYPDLLKGIGLLKDD